ncbi:Oxidoreductase-like domain-containing protein [Abeliophyllum distichum]|uniref:Oxidoreductase-like domain-containing protein n=1 Tax=Abeliophyllum distichum TaxID=126358 RepID=A0ABD1SAA4_9LAMI
MEPTLTLHFQIRPFLRCLPSTSPPLPTHLLRHRHRHRHRNRNRDVLNQPNFVMPIRDLTLRRITTAPYQFRFNHPNPFCASHNFTLINSNTMADKKDIQAEKTESKDEVEKGLEKSKSKSNIPPPPEKAVAGGLLRQRMRKVCVGRLLRGAR